MNHIFVLVMFWTGVSCWCSFILLCGFAASRAYANRRLQEDALASLADIKFDCSGEHESDGQVQVQVQVQGSIAQGEM